MTPFIRAVLFTHLCWFCAVAFAQPGATQPASATQPAPAALPAPDPEIQAAFRAWTMPAAAARANEDDITAFARIMNLKQRRPVNNDQWLKQTYLFLLQMAEGRPEGGWPLDVLLAQHWKAFFQIAPEEYVTALAPYITVRSQQSSAYAMIAAAGAFELTFLGNPRDHRLGFRYIESYLRNLKSNDPSWWVPLVMYHADPDAAIETTAGVYLDRASLASIQRSRKELAIMLLSREVGPEAERNEWESKANAPLLDLARHPHWSVRAYGLQKAADTNMPDYLILAHSMENDPNFLLSSMAREILSASARRRAPRAGAPASVPAP